MPTDTSPPQQDPQKSRPPAFLSALPTFAAPPSQKLDPPLPEVEPSEPLSPSTAPENESPIGRRAPMAPSTDDEPSPRTATSTDRPALKPGGDPAQVAKVIGGLFVIVVTSLSVLARRRGKEFRQPTPEQRDDVARPLARIAVRHLPLDLIGEDLADATEAAVAVHEYAMDGPIVRAPHVDHGDMPTYPEES